MSDEEDEKTVTASEAEENKLRTRPLTKFEQDMMLRAKDRHKNNITKE
jgi:hypothetical protein